MQPVNLESDELGRFFNSEYWKISNYYSTIIPAYFLSIFVGIVELAESDMTYLIQEWLYILQRINQQRPLGNANAISMSVISKLLLKKDHNISSTTRDVIMKPILFMMDPQYLQVVIDEWQSLIMDTYKKLKRDSNLRQSDSKPDSSSPAFKT